MPDRAELVSLLPALGVLVVWIALMPAAGGFNARDWLPAGLVLAGLLLMAVIGGGRLLPTARPARLALVLLLAFLAWNGLSLSWSAAPGDSWDAFNLLLVTTLAAWTITLVPWRPRTVEIGMLVFTVAAAVVSAITLIGAIGATDLTEWFTGDRFSQPLDYPNTSGAFCVLAAIPGLLLAGRPGGGPALRAVCLAAATFLLAFALLPQSRGAVLGGITALLVMLLVVPFRWRLLGALVVAGAGVLVALRPVLDVYDRASAGDSVGPALSAAGWALLAATAVGLLGGALLSVAERRIRPTDETRVTIRRVGFGLLGLVVVAVVAVAALNAGRIAGGLDDQLEALRNPGSEFAGAAANPSGANRLLAADPLERYDYWRVAFDGLRDNPVGGLGTGGFNHAYVTERRYPKPSKYAHNLVLRVAGDTGVVGLLLFLGFTGVIVVGLLRGIREAGRGERAISAAALATIAYFAVHGSLDWLEAYPVLTGPVLAMGLMALVARDRDARLSALPAGAGGAATPRRKVSPLAVYGAGVTVALLAAISLAVPWIALRFSERGAKEWRETPALAYRDLKRATDLNPLATAAPVNLGLIAIQRGDAATARTAFRTALDREQLWLPHLELAFLAHQDGDQAEAERQLRRAQAISPREAVLEAAEPLVRSRKRLSAAEATRQVFEQVSAPSARLS